MTQQTRIFSGIQPTNNLTVGNYLGAIKNWVSLQSQGQSNENQVENLFCIVDLHAITVPQDPTLLHKATLETAATYLASGINPKQSSIFIQSHVRAHTELAWLLSCMTPMGWLNRMTQFKDKAGKNREKAGLGLYAYPTLMAADILLYQTTHVPVGDDQKQHVEMTRDLAQSFNHHYNEDTFTIPEPVIQGEAKRIMSLRDGTKKMSKSDPSGFSRIHLTDSPEDIAQKIKKAKTDLAPLPDSIVELEDRPEAKNLITLYAAFQNMTIDSALKNVAGQNFASFKPQLTEVIISALTPIRENIATYMNDQSELMDILNNGSEKASHIAEKTINDVKETMGFVKENN